MTAYPSQIQMTLGQLCTVLWDSQSQLDMTQPGFEPGTVVTPLILRCSAIDSCTTQEPILKEYVQNLYFFNDSICCVMNCSLKYQTVSLLSR